MLWVDTWHHDEGDQGYKLILDIMMRVTKVIWRCLVTVVLVTKVMYEWYLAIVVTRYMMLIKKMKRDRHEWKVKMTLISYPCLDNKWYEYGSIGANIP